MTGTARRHFWLALLLCVSSVVGHAGPTLLNGTAAQFGTTLLTVEEVYFVRALQRFKEGATDIKLREEGEALRKATQKVVFEEVVFTEMKNLQYTGGPSKSEVEKWLTTKNNGPKGASTWKTLLATYGKSESTALDRMVKSQQVERFLQKKVDTLTPIITDAEAERYYQQNPTKFRTSEYAALKPSIVTLLQKERMQKGLEEWIRFLRDKYGVTNYLES